jgi:hypothetical protein
MSAAARIVTAESEFLYLHVAMLVSWFRFPCSLIFRACRFWLLRTLVSGNVALLCKRRRFVRQISAACCLAVPALSAPLRIAAAASHRTRTSPCVRCCCVYLLPYNSACRSSSSHTLESLGRWHSLQALLFLFGLLSRLWLIPAALALLTLGCDGSLQEVRRHFVFWPRVSCSLANVFRALRWW